MKHLLALALLLIPSSISAQGGMAPGPGTAHSAGGGGGGFTVTQVCGGNHNDGSTPSVATPSCSFTSGRMIVVFAGSFSQQISDGGVTDGVNTYTLKSSQSVGASSASCGIFTATASTTASLTPTFTGTGTNSFFIVAAIEINPAGVVDGTPNNATATDAAPAAGSITTTATGITIGGFAQADHSVTITEAGGWTLIYEQEDGDNFLAGSVIYKLTTAGANNPSWTTSGSIGWVAASYALKP